MKDKRFTHGMSKTSIYRSWEALKTRCNYNESYIKKGIKYSKKWKSFEGFFEDMGGTYKKGLSIERENNDGDYCKSNCKWATRKEQQRNTGQNFIINGKPLICWSEKLNIKYTTLRMRLKRGKTFQEAINM